MTNRKVDLRKIIFYISLLFYIMQSFIDSTALVYYIPNLFSKILLGFALVGFSIKLVFFDRYKYRDVIFIAIWGLIALGVLYQTSYKQVLIFSLIIIACKDIDFISILKFYLAISAFLLIVVVVLSQFDIIVDIVFIRDGVERHSLGTLYPTNVAARVFFCCLAYLVLKFDNLRLLDTVAVTILGIVVLRYTQGRLDSYLIVATALLFYFLSKCGPGLKKFLAVIGVAAPFFGFLISYLASYFYDNSSLLWFNLNRLFSGRLALGKAALNLYPIKGFGQQIYEQGNGGLEGLNNFSNAYFYIDSSYLNILIRFGYIFAFFIFSYSIWKLCVLFRMKKYTIIIAFGLVCVNSIISTFYFGPSYNPFILLLFSSVIDKSGIDFNNEY
ncbi:hypothetical protein [Enterococcus canintestini]|uniref:hypothetical protein n=1 Tax=Enterococcus canintestini TaxID=317010 RepID=UPI0028925A47|nr:hypothetical protein [Enterococcus canintestini]MDT2740339.1 hypothetical protein [Enterococcus canintestini]